MELQGFLEATEAELRAVQEENRALQENYQSLVTKIEKRKRYANGINVQTLEKERISKSKLQRKLREAEKSSKKWEDLYDKSDRENTESWKEIYKLEDAIQGYKKRNATPNHELETLKARFKNAIILDGEGGEYNLKRLEEYATELEMTRDELADALICYGLDHKVL